MSSGLTYYQVAIDYGRLEICQVLLSVGADPFKEHPTDGYITYFIVL